MAPGLAIRPAENRSLAEKCGPVQKMRRITPMSASFSAIPASRTKPGVRGRQRHRPKDNRSAEAAPAGSLQGRRCRQIRSEEHKSELKSLMRTSYAAFCLTNKKHIKHN